MAWDGTTVASIEADAGTLFGTAASDAWNAPSPGAVQEIDLR
jgi:hypothetical protein